MKVALITFLFEPEIGGGAAISVRLLAHDLARWGHQVVVITTCPRGQAGVERSGEVTVYRFFPRNLYWIGEKDRQPAWKKGLWQLLDVWNPHAFWAVRHILAQERPDIVHVHKLRGLSPSVWAAAGRAPLVQTCRDYELMSPEGTLSGQVGRWVQQGAWFLRPYQWLRAWFSRRIAAATAPSHYTLEMLTARRFFPQAIRRVVPNSHGLTLEQLAQRRREVMARPVCQDGRMHLLYLGRLEAVKGVDLLCAAFERCAVHFPDLHLDIAGWGTLEPVLRQRYDRHPQITFHGPLFGEAKDRLFAQSDLLVVPSVWPEVFGIVIAEAYTCGKPVIATLAGGIPEIVEEGITGFLLPPGDINALIETLCRVAADPSSVRRMAPACFERARAYSVERMTEQFLSLYSDLRAVA